MTAEPRPGSGTPDADDGHTINVGPVTVADPGSGTPADDRPTSTPHNRNVEPWNCLTCNPNGWPLAKWIDNERRRRSYNAEAQRTRPAPPAAPVDGLDADFLPRALRGWAKHVRAEDFRTAAEVMELAAIVLEGRAPVDGPVLDERGALWGAVRPFLTRFEVNLHGPNERMRAEMDVLAVEIADAALAAAPSPAPLKLPDVDELAQIIRTADGDHTLGAGALAEAIVAALAAADRGEPTDA